MAKFCINCGTEMDDSVNVCPSCGTDQTAPQQATNTQASSEQVQAQAPAGGEQKSKVVAGILGLFLGGWGIHSFYLGDTKKGVIQIVVSLVTCGVGGLWGFIEGIMILAGSIKTDANGVPLKD